MRMRAAVVVSVVATLAGCGSDGEPAATATTESAPPTSALATSTTVPPTSSTQPETGPPVFESAVYPYALALPSANAPRPFQPATIAWDGQSVVRRGNPFLDTLIGDKVVNIVGLEWPGDLESFAQMFVDHSERHNGCSQARDQRAVTIGGAPALAFVVDSCGLVANENLTFVRVAALREGFGLIAFAESASGREPDDMDRLVAMLEPLEWRTD